MLTPSQLISPSLSRFSQAVSRPKAGYQYFLNADGGSETVGGGDLGTQKINSSPISVPDQKFILNTFNRLETLINLNFTDVVSASNANLRIYFDSEININSSSGKILGVAVPNRFSTGDWFEIFINSSALKDLSNYRQYALIHEIGHALGLEHPFDASDGDYYKSTEPYKSALPNETVMSYRTPLTKNYPDFFTDSDINALSEIWGIRDKTQPVTFDYGQYSEASDICDLLLSGKSSLILGQANSESDKYSLSVKTSTWESPISINMIAKLDDSGIRIDAEQINFANPLISGSLIQGGTGADAIWGKAGWDILDGGAGNDLIRAGNGRDIITGGSGSDELHGDFGWNTFKSEKDGFSDFIAIKSDEFVSNWLYGRAGNNPNGEKADVIEGLDSTDQIKIIGVSTSDLSFHTGATAHGISGIGIYAKSALEGIYTGGNLSLAQITAMTTGDSSADALANQVVSYGWTGI